MKQIKHHKYVTVRHKVPKANEEIVKVQITTGYFSNEVILCEFWLPLTAIDSFGFIKPEIVKARAKHDAGITYDYAGGAAWLI